MSDYDFGFKFGEGTMKEKTVTHQQFEYFSRRVRYWVKYFGLLDWTIYIIKEDLDCPAEIRYNDYSRSATFVLAKYRDDQTRKDLEHSALHEVIHLALALLDIAAKTRFDVSSDEFHKIVESTACRFTTVVSNLSKPQRSRG